MPSGTVIKHFIWLSHMKGCFSSHVAAYRELSVSSHPHILHLCQCAETQCGLTCSESGQICLLHLKTEFCLWLKTKKYFLFHLKNFTSPKMWIFRGKEKDRLGFWAAWRRFAALLINYRATTHISHATPGGFPNLWLGTTELDRNQHQ